MTIVRRFAAAILAAALAALPVARERCLSSCASHTTATKAAPTHACHHTDADDAAASRIVPVAACDHDHGEQSAESIGVAAKTRVDGAVAVVIADHTEANAVARTSFVFPPGRDLTLRSTLSAFNSPLRL